MMTMKETGQELSRWTQDLGRELNKAGRTTWLAGLGAFATLDESGRGLFSELIERGERWQPEMPSGMGGLRAAADQLRGFGRETERRFEGAMAGFEDAMADTLRLLGVPSRDDVKILIDRIEELTHKVEELSARPAQRCNGGGGGRGL